LTIIILRPEKHTKLLQPTTMDQSLLII